MQNRELKINCTVNGQKVSRWANAAKTLLEFLREELLLTGTKRGCDLGDCGCCTVLLNDKPILSCLTFAVDCDGKDIQTIEGIETKEGLHPLQESFIEKGAIQCGFCTPAMVLNGAALLKEHPQPSRSQIKECVSGTICRCTGYVKIIDAIEDASKKLCGSKCETQKYGGA